MIVATALLCLSLNIYNEARSEPIMGQYAVAMVTINRAEKDNSQICHQVFKPKQFSWANSGVTKTKAGWHIAESLRPKDAFAWATAVKIAKVSLEGRMIDITKGATFYHTTAVAPAWRLAMVKTKKIGHHQFYSLPA